jgi:hypothetical protein
MLAPASESASRPSAGRAEAGSKASPAPKYAGAAHRSRCPPLNTQQQASQSRGRHVPSPSHRADRNGPHPPPQTNCPTPRKPYNRRSSGQQAAQPDPKLQAELAARFRGSRGAVLGRASRSVIRLKSIHTNRNTRCDRDSTTVIRLYLMRHIDGWRTVARNHACD